MTRAIGMSRTTTIRIRRGLELSLLGSFRTDPAAAWIGSMNDGIGFASAAPCGAGDAITMAAATPLVWLGLGVADWAEAVVVAVGVGLAVGGGVDGGVGLSDGVGVGRGVGRGVGVGKGVGLGSVGVDKGVGKVGVGKVWAWASACARRRC